MKNKKIIDLCKKSKQLWIYDALESDQQYISDGEAMYPLTNAPVFNDSTICATYDITESQREKIYFRRQLGLPEGITFDDSTPDETLCDIFDLKIVISSGIAIPIITDIGLMFIEQKYLQPLSDMPNYDMRIYRRTDDNGYSYFAVKFGLLVYALIRPFDVVTEQLCNNLEYLLKLSRVALRNKLNEIPAKKDSEVFKSSENAETKED